MTFQQKSYSWAIRWYENASKGREKPQNFENLFCQKSIFHWFFNPIWHGGGGGAWWSPKMFLPTVPKRLGGGNWNLVTFNINLFSIKRSYFWFLRLSNVTMATSLSEGTRDFMKLSFHMFPYNEIYKVFKSKIWINIGWKHLKIPPNTKFQRNQTGGLGVTSIWNLGLCVALNTGYDVIMT